MQKKGFSAVFAYVAIFVLVLTLGIALVVNYHSSVQSFSNSLRSYYKNIASIGVKINITVYNITYNQSATPDELYVYVHNSGTKKVTLDRFTVYAQNYIPNSTDNRTMEILAPDMRNYGILDAGENLLITIKKDFQLNRTYQLVISARGQRDIVHFANRIDKFQAFVARDDGLDGTNDDTTRIATSNNVRARIQVSSAQNRFLYANYSMNASLYSDAPYENASTGMNIYNSSIKTEHYENNNRITTRTVEVWNGTAFVNVGTLPFRGTAAGNEGTDLIDSTSVINITSRGLANPAAIRIRVGTTGQTPSMFVDLMHFKAFYTVFWHETN
jgi:archaellum component FlaG (FlaF/FlaG flagellin family)